MPRTKMLSVTKKDLIRQTFRAGGKGGQKQNKTETGVRFIHPASGARAESREERSQHQNEVIAFRRLANSLKFRQWVALRHAEIVRGETVEQEVLRAMRDENLKYEVRQDGHWMEESL